jgi:ABC-type glycerol-3-phosphate transport system permease component
MIRRPLFLLCAAAALFMCAPILLTVFTALKPASEAAMPWMPPTRITFEHFAAVWTSGGFSRYFLTSFVISAADALLMIAMASLAAYGITFMDFAGKAALRVFFLFGLMIPATAIILPLYSSLRGLGLINTRAGVILADVALAMPIFVFLFESYFKKVPNALREAAKVDGASEWQIYRRIVLPISMPVVVTAGLLEFLWSWNDLLLRLLLLPREDLRTLSVGLLMFQGSQTRDISGLSAGAVIMSAPVIVLFILFQRHFVRGMTQGALK